jgi:hypothetical protein
LNKKLTLQGTMAKQTNGEPVPPHKTPQLAECHGELYTDLDHSVWDMLLSTATHYPKVDAVISLWQAANHLDNLVGRSIIKETKPGSEVDSSGQDESHFRWTYEELVKATELVAGLLQSKGCVEGENLVSRSNPTSCRETKAHRLHR